MTQLNIDSIASIGGFVSGPVKKKIEWKGNQFDVYVKPFSYTSVVHKLDSELTKQGRIAAQIAESICDESGQPVFTAADITGVSGSDRGPLDGDLALALLAVIGEVNGLGKPEESKTASPKRMNSGAS